MFKQLFLVLAIALAAPAVYAGDNNNGDNNCRGNCPQTGGSTGGPTTNTVAPTINVGSTNVNRNTLNNQNQIEIANRTNVNSEAEAAARANARSSSDSSASSNSGGNRLSATGGQADARATGGDAKAAGGDAVAHNDGNSVTNNVDASNDYDAPAASAAAVFAGYCQSGTSGQVQSGGFSITNSEQFCDYIRLSAVMREAYEYEMRNPVCEPIEIGFVDRGGNEQIQSAGEICTPSEKAQEYLDAYHENLSDAHSLIQQTQVTGQVDRTFGQLLRPIAMIAGLILLL